MYGRQKKLLNNRDIPHTLSHKDSTMVKLSSLHTKINLIWPYKEL